MNMFKKAFAFELKLFKNQKIFQIPATSIKVDLSEDSRKRMHFFLS